MRLLLVALSVLLLAGCGFWLHRPGRFCPSGFVPMPSGYCYSPVQIAGAP